MSEFNIRNLELKDAPGILEWMHDPETLNIFQKDFSNFNLLDVENFIRGIVGDKELHLACVDDKDEYLGTVSLKNIDLINKKAEFAISFRKIAQGTGAAAYATSYILEKAFKELKIERVYLFCLEDNYRAVKFYKKMGFVEDGFFKKDLWISGSPKNTVWFSKIV
ncbi:MAG: GNAT family N-acetyltransferase [Parasutterella sp.]|uniref:GNAT family N-acetyltransferase n=1 Tax=Parasutterella sp. TaxID=2049037 RepID=UPI003995B941